VRVETRADAIAAGLGQLFQMSEADRRQMAVKGRNLVATRFAWYTVAAQTLAVCEWLLGLKPKPACVLHD